MKQELEPLLNKIHHSDAIDLMRRLPDTSVDLIVTDPPYFGIVGNDWDNQWKNRQDFLQWMDKVLIELKRVLKSNGSLYIFASHRLQGFIEVGVDKHFRGLNNIVWLKTQATAKQTDRTAMRSYIPTVEHCIFAEQKNGDSLADDLAGYTDADRQLKKRLFGREIKQAMSELSINTHELVEAVGAYNVHNNGGAATNWTQGYNIPTKQQYELIKSYLNMKSLGGKYLRREYEDLRRPFYLDLAGENECNVWYFRPPSKRVHPTQKPLDMIEHILNVSSKPNQIILDPFAGSGTTAIAARKIGRQFICGDLELEYVEIARKRLQDSDPYQATELDNGMKQLSLFGNK